MASVRFAFSFFSLLLLGSFASLSFALDPNEIQALLDMQAEWNMTTWTGSPSCSWSGITCDTNGHIVNIDLPFKNLKGTIPDSIAELVYLTNLDLSSNSLSGSIPPTLGNASFQTDSTHN